MLFLLIFSSFSTAFFIFKICIFILYVSKLCIKLPEKNVVAKTCRVMLLFFLDSKTSFSVVFNKCWNVNSLKALSSFSKFFFFCLWCELLFKNTSGRLHQNIIIPTWSVVRISVRLHQSPSWSLHILSWATSVMILYKINSLYITYCIFSYEWEFMDVMIFFCKVNILEMLHHGIFF